MNVNQYKSLTETPISGGLISVTDLKNQEPRTLLFGTDYNSVGRTFFRHVYLGADGLFHTLKYGFPSTDLVHLADHTSASSVNSEDLASIHGIQYFPAVCDFEFCTLITAKHLRINFLDWKPSNGAQIFRMEELTPTPDHLITLFNGNPMFRSKMQSLMERAGGTFSSLSADDHHMLDRMNLLFEDIAEKVSTGQKFGDSQVIPREIFLETWQDFRSLCGPREFQVINEEMAQYQAAARQIGLELPDLPPEHVWGSEDGFLKGASL